MTARSAPALRREARPLAWRDCTDSQKDAFEGMVGALEHAVADLDHDQQHSTRDLSSAFEVAQTTSTQTYLISGDRGTGKSSLYWTLKRALIAQAPWDPIDVSKRDARDGYAGFESLCRRCNELSQRVIWLEPLEVEFLPASTNLLAAILARVEEIIERLGTGSRRHDDGNRHDFQEEAGVEDALMSLLRLQTDVSLAWDGNLSMRRGHLDPDTFAAETIRAEHARMRLAADLSNVLDHVARDITWRSHIREPVFVLPIDDFDLDAGHCWNLIRLLRMIRAPRLFVLVLGNTSTIQTAIQLHTAGRLADIAATGFEPTATEDVANEIRQTSRSLSFNALRKLFPIQQRRELLNLTVENALDRSYFVDSEPGPGESTVTLRTLLEESRIAVANNRSLLDCVARTPFYPDVVAKGGGWLNDWAYSGTPVLALPIRHWMDLADLMVKADPAADRVARFGGFLVERFQECLAGASGLEAYEARLLEDSFEYSLLLNEVRPIRIPVPVTLEPRFGDAHEVPRSEEDGPKLHLNSHLQWTATATVDPDGIGGDPDGTGSRLTPHQFSAFAALHDHCVATLRTHVSRVPETDEMGLVCAEWRVQGPTSIQVPWLAPPFRSIWSWDHLSDFCSYAFQDVDGTDWRQSAALAAMTWIEAGTTLTVGERLGPFAPTADTKAILKRCEQLREIVDRLAVKRASYEPVPRAVDAVNAGWLASLALLCAPESGLQTGLCSGLIPEVAEVFLRSDSLEYVWQQNGIAERIRNYRTQTAAEFLIHDHPRFEELFFSRTREDVLRDIVAEALQTLDKANTEAENLEATLKDQLTIGERARLMQQVAKQSAPQEKKKKKKAAQKKPTRKTAQQVTSQRLKKLQDDLRPPAEFQRLSDQKRRRIIDDVVSNPEGPKSASILNALEQLVRFAKRFSLITLSVDVRRASQISRMLEHFPDWPGTLNTIASGRLCPLRYEVEHLARRQGWTPKKQPTETASVKNIRN